MSGPQKERTKPHPNESEEVIIATCYNCRNENTPVCYRWLKQKREYLKKNGFPLKTRCCKFWAYNPVGLWATVMQTKKIDVNNYKNKQ